VFSPAQNIEPSLAPCGQILENGPAYFLDCGKSPDFPGYFLRNRLSKIQIRSLAPADEQSEMRWRQMQIFHERLNRGETRMIIEEILARMKPAVQPAAEAEAGAAT
jgi:hypothetical protein